MWEKIKKIFLAVGGVLAAIGAFLLGRNLRSSKGRTGPVEADLDTAKAGNTDAKAAADSIKHTVESVESVTGNIEQRTDECLSIIENIESRGTKTKD